MDGYMEITRFRNRAKAGQLLAAELQEYSGSPNTIILGLPRGGVEVAAEMAKVLSVPMDIYLVRKLGLPGQEEFAIGAIAEDGVRVLNDDLVQELAILPETIDRIVCREQLELSRRRDIYRFGSNPPQLNEHNVILVDDGLATGASMRAAIKAVQKHHPAKLIVAVPVAASSVYEELAKLVDQFVCLNTPDLFYAVGEWYEQFPQLTDGDVMKLLSGKEGARLGDKGVAH